MVAALAAGCGPRPHSYVGVFVAQHDDGTPVLAVIGEDDDAFTGAISQDLRTVEVATGELGPLRDLGSGGSCLPSIPGRIWCARVDGRIKYEPNQDDYVAGAHEARRLDTFERLADDEVFADNSGGKVRTEDIQVAGTFVTVRCDERTLLFDYDHQTWAVDPASFVVSRVHDEEAYPCEVTSGEVPYARGDNLNGLASAVKVDGFVFHYGDDGRLTRWPEGEPDPQPQDVGETRLGGMFVLADPLGSSPLLTPDPTSFLVVGWSGEDLVVSRVAVEDGRVLWTHASPRGDSVDAVTVANGVVAIMQRQGKFDGSDSNPILHATAFGVSLDIGATRWTLDM